MKSDLFFVQTPEFLNVCAFVAPLWRSRYETTSSDDSSSEDSSSSGSDEEDEEKEFVGKEEEYKNVEGKHTTKEFQPEGAEDGKKEDKEESSEKQEMRERWVQENNYYIYCFRCSEVTYCMLMCSNYINPTFNYKY